jgi:hypothetical protein
VRVGEVGMEEGVREEVGVEVEVVKGRLSDSLLIW